MAVTDEAILKIKNMIIDGRLRPGDRLPPEKELSESLGLSRSSLREAVKALEIIRVLDVRRGDGTFVTSLEPALLLEAMSFVVDLHEDASVLELFAVRRILEPAAAAMATGRASADDIARISGLVDAVAKDAAIEAFVEHDLEFHHAIAELAGNGYLMGLLDGLSSGTQRARVWRGLTQEHVVERSLGEHRAIVAAMGAGDVELVRARVAVHVAGVEDWLRQAASA